MGPSFYRGDIAVCGLMTLVQEDQEAFTNDTALIDSGTPALFY